MQRSTVLKTNEEMKLNKWIDIKKANVVVEAMDPWDC